MPATPQGRAYRASAAATKEGRRHRRAAYKGFAFGASPSSGGPRPRPQKGAAALPDVNLRAAPGAGSASSCTGQYSPSHLGPPKARIMSISWKPWASLGAPSPADAHDARACGAHHEVTAAGGSSIIEFAGAAPHRPKTCPNATRNACAFRSHSPANFEFPRRAGDPARARITSISGTPATQRSRVGGNGVFFIKASPLRLRQALAAQSQIQGMGKNAT